jgi:hypothetical protein
MKEYGTSFEDLLMITPRRFWFLHNQLDRIKAQEHVFQLQLLGSVQSGEAYEAAMKNLNATVGQVFYYDEPASAPVELKIDPHTGLDPEFDREGLRALKARHSHR